MKKIGLFIIGLVLSLIGGCVLIAPDAALAVNSDICNGPFDADQKAAAGCGQSDGKDVGTVALSVIQVVLGFLGVIAVGVVIYGGFLFLMSSGDAGKVKRGQDAIKYGLIGLVVALLASGIVLFVSKVIGS